MVELLKKYHNYLGKAGKMILLIRHAKKLLEEKQNLTHQGLGDKKYCV